MSGSRPTLIRAYHRRIRVVVAGALTGALLLLAAMPGGAAAPSRGRFIGGDLHSLVVSPTDPSRLFVGGHEAVTTSRDAGQSWRAVRSLEDADAMGWGFAGDTVWVSGHPGLNRSEDGGRTFQRTNAGLPNTDVHAFGAGPSILYGASPAVGVFASTDDGKTWEVRSDEVGHGFFGRIVVDPVDADHVLAADAANGAVESRDGGRTWTRLGGQRSAGWLSASTDLTQLVASGPDGVRRSTDGGATWRRIRVPKRALLVELHVDEPDVLYAAANVDGRARVWVSRDGGLTWART